ncbi:MAG: M23 family metallopeptidase [Desulfuromonadales bacterium]|nr:M23 family metallopeptidase [Desulfuromonadales bacterium]MBN2791495.1 M23 family metallopeptidase [Desulfuromonadales bacterium]
MLVLIQAHCCVAELQLNGHFIQGGLVYGQTENRTKIYLDTREVPVSAAGNFILGFGRDAAAQQQLTLIHPDGKTEQQVINLAQRNYDIQRITGISKRLMEPTEEDLKRIHQETQAVTLARRQISDQDHCRDNFMWPLVGRITGIYGSQRIFNGEARRPHFGIDIAAPTGTAVIAPAGGVVTLVHPGMFFSGKTLIIDHGYGLSSSFLHLHQILVKPGETVTRGQTIATVGATGRVTGPHLDWRVNWFEERLDPALLVSEMPGG